MVRRRNLLHESGGILDEKWDYGHIRYAYGYIKRSSNYSYRTFYILIEENHILQPIKISTTKPAKKLNKIAHIIFVKKISPIKQFGGTCDYMHLELNRMYILLADTLSFSN
jgi:hypothetical protein